MFVDVLPDGYLKLTIPAQQSAACPQPCANPTKCYPSGCSQSCCSYDPLTQPAQTAPAPPPPTAPPACPSSCPPACAPSCSQACCDKPMGEAQQPAMRPAMPTAGPPAIMFAGYTTPAQSEQPAVAQQATCPAPSCPASCFPDCSQDCCSMPEESQCSNQCTQFCSNECPQECCDRKSRVNQKQKALLPPIHGRALPRMNHALYNRQSYMYRPKTNPQRNPIKQAKATSLNRGRINPYGYASVWQPYLKLAQDYGYGGTKQGTARNKVEKKKPQSKGQATAYRRTASHRFGQSQRLQRSPYYGQLQKTNYYGNARGMKLIKELKAKGTPVNVKYAYRYGNRLLVPVDLPKDMEFKEVKGKKFISVPAFRRNHIPRPYY